MNKFGSLLQKKMTGNSNLHRPGAGLKCRTVRLCGFILAGNYVNGKDSVGVKELNKEF